MCLGSGSPVGIVARICLRDEDPSFRIDGKTVEQGSERIDGLDQFVRFRIEDKEVAIGYLWVLDDVGDNAER